MSAPPFRAVAAAALLAAAHAAGAPLPGATHVVTPADIMSLRDVREPRIAPDGAVIAYSVVEHPPDGKPDRSTLWMVPTAGDTPPRRLLDDPNATGNDPQFSPDGRRIAFLDARGGGPATVWVAGADGHGTPTRLTTFAGDISAFRWSPDGTRIAFIATPPETDAARRRKDEKKDWDVAGTGGPLARLYVIGRDGHGLAPVSDPALNVDDVDWLGAGGTRLVVRVTDKATVDDHWYHSRVELLDTEAPPGDPSPGRALRVLEPVAAADPIHGSPDGTRVACTRLGPAGIGATAEIVDVASGRATPVAPKGPALIWDMQWDPDGRGLLAEAFEHTATVFLAVDAAHGTVRPVAHGWAEAPDFTRSRDGRVTAWIGQAPDGPNDVHVLGPDERDRRRTDANPAVRRWRLGTVHEMRWRAADGMTIYGVLVLPPDYRDGHPVRTIVQIHGGPEWAWWSGWLGSWHEWAQMLASHGYAVFLPNMRGSDGQGNAFARAVIGDLGGADYRDMLSGLAVLERERIADPHHLGIGGWSYGGFMTAAAIGHDDRFRAAVVGAGMINLVTMSLTTDTPDYIPGYLGDPLAQRDAYLAHSPESLIARIRTPVLVLHGEADSRVPTTQGVELATALERAHRPVAMVRYPREPHWFEEREHQEDVLRRVLAWFDGHV